MEINKAVKDAQLNIIGNVKTQMENLQNVNQKQFCLFVEMQYFNQKCDNNAMMEILSTEMDVITFAKFKQDGSAKMGKVVRRWGAKIKTKIKIKAKDFVEMELLSHQRNVMMVFLLLRKKGVLCSVNGRRNDHFSIFYA